MLSVVSQSGADQSRLDLLQLSKHQHREYSNNLLKCLKPLLSEYQY